MHIRRSTALRAFASVLLMFIHTIQVAISDYHHDALSTSMIAFVTGQIEEVNAFQPSKPEATHNAMLPKPKHQTHALPST
jgi:hypothetical protein